jgi:hypothetical protein
MQHVITVFLFAMVLVSAQPAAAIEPAYADRIANAIYKAEGGPLAKVPYGILSVKVRGEKEARKVCLNTIRNNWRRWKEAGYPGQFIDFLGNRYCPPSVDPVGNRNWRRNVKYFLARSKPRPAPAKVSARGK